MAKKCPVCNRDISESKEYCFFDDPSIPAELKKRARQRGGQNSKKKPLGIKPDDVLPLNTWEDLKNYQNKLIRRGIEEFQDDYVGYVKIVHEKVIPELEKVLAYEFSQEVMERLSRLESSKQRYLPNVEIIKPDNQD